MKMFDGITNALTKKFVNEHKEKSFHIRKETKNILSDLRSLTGELETKELHYEGLYDIERKRNRIFKAITNMLRIMLQETKNSNKETVKNIMGILGKAVSTERVYIFKNFDENLGKQAFFVNGWYDNIDYKISDGYSFNYNTFTDDWMQYMECNHILCGDIGSQHIPNDIRDSLQAKLIKSVCIVPIYVNGNWWGFLGFDTLDERVWTYEEGQVLHVAAGIIGSYLEKQCKTCKEDCILNKLKLKVR